MDYLDVKISYSKVVYDVTSDHITIILGIFYREAPIGKKEIVKFGERIYRIEWNLLTLQDIRGYKYTKHILEYTETNIITYL